MIQQAENKYSFTSEELETLGLTAETSIQDKTEIRLQYYTDLKITGASEAEKAGQLESLALDIKPMLRAVIVNKSDPEKFIIVGSGRELSVGGSVEMKIPVGGAFGNAQTLYITYIISNGNRYYTGTVSNGILTFTNPDGFSTFIISVNPPALPAQQAAEKGENASITNRQKAASFYNITLQPAGTVQKFEDGRVYTSLGDGTYYDQNNIVWDGFGNKIGTWDAYEGKVVKITVSKVKAAKSLIRVVNTCDDGIGRHLGTLAESVAAAVFSCWMLKRR